MVTLECSLDSPRAWCLDRRLQPRSRAFTKYWDTAPWTFIKNWSSGRCTDPDCFSIYTEETREATIHSHLRCSSSLSLQSLPLLLSLDQYPSKGLHPPRHLFCQSSAVLSWRAVQPSKLDRWASLPSLKPQLIPLARSHRHILPRAQDRDNRS